MHRKLDPTNLKQPSGNFASQGAKDLVNPRGSNHDIAAENTHSNAGQHGGSHLDSTTIPNLEAVKARQKATWEAGDFGQIARTIENVADEFMARQPDSSPTRYSS